MPEKREKRNIARTEIINYMLNHSVTSKAELAKELGLSMPTVLTNVNELIAKGLIVENGEYASTGGRKAKSIGINREYCRAMGLVITANHLEMVLVNLGYEIEHLKRVRLKFSPDIDYSVKIAGHRSACTRYCQHSVIEEQTLEIIRLRYLHGGEGLFYPANRFTLCDDFLNDTGIFAEVFVYKDEVAQFVIVSAAVGVEHVFGWQLRA